MEKVYSPINEDLKQFNLVKNTNDDIGGIIFMFGNIFETQKAKYILNVASCRGHMQTGFSKKIKKNYPKVYDEYRKFLVQFDKRTDLRGKYLILDGGNVEFANLFSVYHFFDKYNYFDPVAFESSFNKFIDYATDFGKKSVTVAIPINYKGLISSYENDIILNCVYKTAMHNNKVNLEVWVNNEKEFYN